MAAATSSGCACLSTYAIAPAPSAEELAALREEDDSALVIVVAPEIDSDARELGASVDAVGYLKKGVAVADIAAVVLELAAVGQVKR